MKTVFVDVDTQYDFLLPSGALYAPGAERIVPAVAALNQYAARMGSVVLSTTDAHTENDPEFASWPPHCVAGTLGQRKPESTLLAPRVSVPSQPSELPELTGVRQVLVEKQHLNCFTNANLPELLERIPADRYVVYGVVTEYCVKFAALGLLERGQSVVVVEDAIRSLDDTAAAATLKEIRERGGAVLRISDILL